MPSPERDRDLFYSKSVDHDTLAIGVPEWRRHLSNFAEMPQPLELHGRRYRTVEHAYQAHKFIHVNDAAVADTFTIDSPANVGRTGADAKRAANSRSLSLGASWDAAKDEVMRQALSARALVDDKFVQVLLAAREQERPLQHYEPQRDPYWGGTKDAAGRFRGRNRLGELLMQLAEQLSHGGSGTEESTFELRQRLSARDPTASALVVGISGCSRSGKSELARELAATGDAVLAFDQDDYSSKDLARHATPPGAGSILAGFETSDSIQHEKLFGEVARARASGRHRLIVVEGFRAFHDPRLVELMDVLIWLELGRESCRRRRMATKRCKPAHFDQHLWPRHEAYRDAVFAPGGPGDRAVTLDGEQPPARVLSEATAALARALAPAPAAAGGASTASDEQKQLRKLQKALRDIEKLKERHARGAPLELTQLSKLEGEAEVREKLAQLEAGAPPAAPTGEQEGHAPQQEARAPQREQSWGARSLRHALPAVGGAAAAAAPPVAAASGAARKSPRLAAAQSAPKRQCSWGGTSLSQALSAAPAPAPSTAEPSQRSRGGQSGSSGAPKRGGKTRNQQKASARAAAGAQRTAGDAVEEVPPKRQKSGE